MSLCKYCGAPIEWIRTQEGKTIPVDQDPVFVVEGDGKAEFYLEDMAEPITGREAKPEEDTKGLEVAFVPHFRTCRQADKPTRRRTERGAGYGGLSPAT